MIEDVGRVLLAFSSSEHCEVFFRRNIGGPPGWSLAPSQSKRKVQPSLVGVKSSSRQFSTKAGGKSTRCWLFYFRKPFECGQAQPTMSIFLLSSKAVTFRFRNTLNAEILTTLSKGSRPSSMPDLEAPSYPHELQEYGGTKQLFHI